MLLKCKVNCPYKTYIFFKVAICKKKCSTPDYSCVGFALFCCCYEVGNWQWLHLLITVIKIKYRILPIISRTPFFQKPKIEKSVSRTSIISRTPTLRFQNRKKGCVLWSVKYGSIFCFTGQWQWSRQGPGTMILAW